MNEVHIRKIVVDLSEGKGKMIQREPFIVWQYRDSMTDSVKVLSIEETKRVNELFDYWNEIRHEFIFGDGMTGNKVSFE